MPICTLVPPSLRISAKACASTASGRLGSPHGAASAEPQRDAASAAAPGHSGPVRGTSPTAAPRRFGFLRRLGIASAAVALLLALAGCTGVEAALPGSTPNIDVEVICAQAFEEQLDGFEVLEHIRRTSTVPVIMLTAKGAVSDKRRLFGSGRTTISPSLFPTKSFRRAFTRFCGACAGGLRPEPKPTSFTTVGWSCATPAAAVNGTEFRFE